MISLARFDTFRAVVEAGSLTAAAHVLGQTRAVVSFNLKRLETELGVALLTRSTRRLALTEPGERFYHHCLAILEAAELAVDDARSEHNDLRGTLRITTTPEYGVTKIVPLLEAFGRLHPALQIHLSTSSFHADLISERFDVAIRLGAMDDSSHRAVQLTSFEIRPVATPDFLKRQPRGKITTMGDLSEAPWIEHSRLGDWTPWKATAPDGAKVTYQPLHKPVASTDNAGVLRGFALAHMGVALLPLWLIETDVIEGRLVNLLPAYTFPTQGIYAVYPETRHVSSKVRAFIDFCKAG